VYKLFILVLLVSCFLVLGIGAYNTYKTGGEQCERYNPLKVACLVDRLNDLR